MGMKRTHTADGADVEHLREGCAEPYASKLKTLNVMGKILEKKMCKLPKIIVKR